MDESSVLRQVANWGYYLLPRLHPHSPGHPGLLIAIRQTPTEKHFDPETVQLHLCASDGGSEVVTLTLTSSLPGSSRVCPGMVTLHDRVDKRAGFFIFGGSLEASFNPGETVYALRSAAPILPVTESQSISGQLACETQALLAGLQSRWGAYDKAFEQRLAQVDPVELYQASLHAILQRYEKAPALRQSFPGFYTALSHEKQWLAQAQQWPARPVGLDELLAPP